MVSAALPEGSRLRDGVIALGNFDGFHRGHRLLIGTARRIAATRRPVAIMSVEPHPRQFFATPGTAPFRLATAAQKLRAAQGIGLGYLFQPAFDAEFAGLSPEAFIETVLHARLGVSHVVVGADFRFGAKRAGDCRLLADLCLRHDIGVTLVPLQGGFSSSAVRAALRAGDLEAACASLGRTWQVELVARPEVTQPGSLQGWALAPELIRPPAGRYLIRAEGKESVIDLTAEGCLMGASGPVPRWIEILARCR
ncbi:pantothenate synthetase (plasmid) [Paracoccus aminophilus JCM 7686]|uniref:FAD synthase n=1 Tax=Paracoccus aminophilus JCM 7686 TaxID=1367847 RepID=S5YIN6_PARAH|nr:pantothenate synthetase [Paracoccus aminophilus JCM 7686]